MRAAQTRYDALLDAELQQPVPDGYAPALARREFEAKRGKTLRA